MKNYFTIVCLFFIVIAGAQNFSLTDSIHLYNGESITRDSQIIKLQTPDYVRALELSRRLQYKAGEFTAIIKLGDQAERKGKLENALIKYQEAYSIAKDLNEPAKISASLNYLASLYMTLGDYDLALDYFQESLEINKQEKDTLQIGSTLSNIGGLFLKLEKGDSAMVYLNHALAIFESYDFQKGEAYTLNSMGVYYLEKEQPEKALHYFDQIMEKDFIDSDLLIKGSTLINTASVNGYLKNYDKAETAYYEALDIYQKNNFKTKELVVYGGLAYLYSLMGDYKQAYEFQEKHYLLKDSISGVESQERIAALELEYDVMSKEKTWLKSKTQLTILEEKQKSSRLRMAITFFFLIGMLLMGGFFFIRLKHKQKQLVLENQQIIYNLEEFREKLNLVEGVLESKNQDLTDFALDIARKNEIAAQLVTALNKVEKHLKNKTNEDFKALKSLVASHHQINEDISFFQENIDTINNDFFKSLKADYPDLTKKELQLCGLIRLNLSTKDIATMRNVARKSIEMGRYRLRRKFALEKGEDLNEFLMELSAT